MKAPLILISSGRFMDTLSMSRRQSELYAACLSAVGGAGVLYSGTSAAPLATRCDGLLLAGGGDIHPARYGQTCICDRLSIDLVRDTEEQALFDAFFARGKPVLGICRGMQAINVFLGGTLLQHAGDHANCCHTIRCTGWLAEQIGENTVVNSYHHQIVDRIANTLTAVAHAPDKSVEALVHPSAALLGVQWHPERMVPSVCEDVAEVNHLPLFSWLCAHC
ncbi:gamma-glutamyl-gamma-aminobutyrate hydrolase family protein [Candidatus Agathobaculum pullicola]|uniref:gamma-glutamyl-gamma-aminobutyrate hydrolase family protein n=1 Tax=Candidatus Agathobaculum pullicola TaxID=2838426 RepID=UPI003F92C2BF